MVPLSALPPTASPIPLVTVEFAVVHRSLFISYENLTLLVALLLVVNKHKPPASVPSDCRSFAPVLAPFPPSFAFNSISLSSARTR